VSLRLHQQELQLREPAYEETDGYFGGIQLDAGMSSRGVNATSNMLSRGNALENATLDGTP
jgi:hypothetical protein